MHLARVVTGDGDPVWVVGVGGAWHPLAASHTLASLTAGGRDGLRALMAAADRSPLAAPVRLLAPLDPLTEVWAAGVTYEVSRQARIEESADGDIYSHVYDAARPELFLKSIGWRVAGGCDPIGVRRDSDWNVPEPELALVIGADQAVVGVTICNDVSSRSIEGENPLYLPQAKLFRGACAVGPWITPIWELDPAALTIRASIERAGRVLWEAETTTARIRRSFEELVSYLFFDQEHPHAVVLSTGTGLVPGPEVSLSSGDVVDIAIDGIGTLRNQVS